MMCQNCELAFSVPPVPGQLINEEGETGFPPTAFEESQHIVNLWKALS